MMVGSIDHLLLKTFDYESIDPILIRDFFESILGSGLDWDPRIGSDRFAVDDDQSWCSLTSLVMVMMLDDAWS